MQESHLCVKQNSAKVEKGTYFVNYEYFFLLRSRKRRSPIIAMFRRLEGVVEPFPIDGDDWVAFDPVDYWKKWKQIVNFSGARSTVDFAFAAPHSLIDQVAIPREFKKSTMTKWTRNDACKILQMACDGSGEFGLKEKNVTIVTPSISCLERFELLRFNVPKGENHLLVKREKSRFYELMRDGDLPPSLKDYVCNI